MERHVHVDEIRENLWGVLLQKHHCDIISEGNHETILKWWETTTTISPIKKDVKRRCINAKVFYKHPPSYLQESHVYFTN